MQLTQLDNTYWVGPQITVEDVRDAKAQGFEVIVCNRPDGEAADQPSAAEIRKACEEAGIRFVELPMRGPNYTSEMLDTLNALLEENDKVLGYCRTGNRSTILYRAAKGEA